VLLTVALSLGGHFVGPGVGAGVGPGAGVGTVAAGVGLAADSLPQAAPHTV